MTIKITDRQQQVLDFIANYVAEYGSSPTLVEIGEHFKFSRNAAMCHIVFLQKKGALSVRPGVSRGIKLAAA